MRDEDRARKDKPWYLLLIVSQDVAAEKIAGTGLLRLGDTPACLLEAEGDGEDNI